MFEDEELVDPRLIDPNEPIEDLVARVRQRVLAVETDPNPDFRQRFENWRERQQFGRRFTRRRRSAGRFNAGRASVGHSRFGPTTRVVNAVLLVVAVGIVGVVVLLQFDGGASPVGDPVATTTQSVPKPLANRKPLAQPKPKAVVPAAWKARCREAPGLSRVAETGWACAATTGVNVEVLTFGDAKTTRNAFRGAAARLGHEQAPAITACGGVGDEPATWSRHSEPDVVVGVFACGATSRGAELIWTVNASHTVVRAVRNDGDVRQLFDWWDSIGAHLAPL